MLIIGLTGSIGMGKSTVAKRFAEHGIAVCDADAEVHKLYADGGRAVAPIEAAFPGTTGPGGVDRQKLGAQLLANPAGFKKLEAIVHPLVRDVERDFLVAEKARGAAMAVLEIPLLFEGKGHTQVDVTVVVSAPADVQKARVLERPGMTVAKLEQILSRQTPDAEKRARADFVVDTGLPLEETLAQVDNVIAALRGRTGEAFQRCWA
ncbi:MAG: dephospho-CoA kinase [Hyphomicrobiaceae bacterium]|nr:dephospho-CoA kinase [Hyphomicrobiaceae bacterium]